MEPNLFGQNFDSRMWVERAESFFRNLRCKHGRLEDVIFEKHAPVSMREVERWERKLPTRLPAPLREFFTGTAGCVEMNYWWYPPRNVLGTLSNAIHGIGVRGGLRIGPPKAMVDSRWIVKRDLFENKPVADALPFLVPILHYGDGDQICLDMRAPKRCMPMVFLAHDSMLLEGWSWDPISPNFGSFMVEWEQAGYVEHIYKKRMATKKSAHRKESEKQLGRIVAALKEATILRSR